MSEDGRPGLLGGLQQERKQSLLLPPARRGSVASPAPGSMRANIMGMINARGHGEGEGGGGPSDASPPTVQRRPSTLTLPPRRPSIAPGDLDRIGELSPHPSRRPSIRRPSLSVHDMGSGMSPRRQSFAQRRDSVTPASLKACQEARLLVAQCDDEAIDEDEETRESEREEREQALAAMSIESDARSAQLSAALNSVSNFLRDADASGAIDEARANEIGAAPPFGGGNTNGGDAFARGRNLKGTRGRRNGMRQRRPDGLGSDDEDALPKEEAEKAEPEFDTAVLMTRLAEGRQRLEAMHGQLVDSLHTAVSQREDARTETTMLGTQLQAGQPCETPRPGP